MAEEQQQQPSMEEVIKQQKEQCVFCKIITGEIPSEKVYEDDLVLAIMDINPAVEGHVLIMPKEHYPIMPLIPRKDFSQMFKIAKYIGRAQKDAFHADKVSIFIANGGIAGQQSAHFMIHSIPRFEGDSLAMLNCSGDIVGDVSQIEGFLKQNLPVALQNYAEKEGDVREHLISQTTQPSQSQVQEQVKEEKTKTEEKKQMQKSTEEQKKKISQLYNDNEEFKDLLINRTEELKELVETNEKWNALFNGINIDALAAKLKELEDRE